MLFINKNSFLLLFFPAFLILFSFQLLGQEWQPLGPFYKPAITFPNDNLLKFANGTGRVTCLKFDFDDSLKKRILYLGSPYGGLYKSWDEGLSWSEVKLGNFTPGISDFIIHPKNRSIQFVLTGDPDCILDPNSQALGSESCQSGGIFMSKDSGYNWTEEALGAWYDTTGKIIPGFWKYPSMKVMRKMIIHPLRPSIMFVVIHTYNYQTKVFDGYVYKTTDGGKKWKISLYAPGGKLKDLEINPSNPKVIYASGHTVFRTMNGGKTWQSLQGNGLPPDSLTYRCDLATVQAYPDFIFVLVCNKKTKQNEIYLSTNKGNKFHFAGRGTLSPDWRTALAVQQKDTSRIYFSTGNKLSVALKQGQEYKIISTVNTIHDDLHDLTVDPASSKIYASTDGGLYISSDSGRTWINANSGLNVAECWSVAVSQNGPERILSGLQDCGTILYTTDSSGEYDWYTVRGGDGMETAFDLINPNICYSADGNNNIFSRSNDGGLHWSRNLAVFNESFAYLHPFAMNPYNPSGIFLPYHNLYKSTDRGENFHPLNSSELPDNKESICAISISPSDSNTIYIAYSNPSWNENPKEKIFMTRNGGENWTDISKGLTGVNYQNITSIVADPNDPLHVTVGFRGACKIKAMTSFEGGKNNSWIDISEGLPPEADINSMIYDTGERGLLFVATHRGVWQYDTKSNYWSQTGKGLPSMMISDLDICTDTHVLYAGTHGRGIWKLILK